MPRFNQKLFVILVLIFMSTTLSASFCLAQDNEEELAFWLGVGKRYMRDGNIEQAASAFRRVLKIMPDHPDAVRGLSEVLERQKSKSSELRSNQVTGQLLTPPILETEADLIRDYRGARSLEDRKRVALRLAELYLGRAKGLEQDQKLARAMLYFRKARSLSPSNALVHYEIFKALIVRKRSIEAIDAAGRFLQLQGYGALASEVRRQLLKVHLSVGEKCVKRSRWEEAAEHFQKVFDLDSRSRQAAVAIRKLALVHYTLSSTFHAKGRYVDSARHLDGLLKLKEISEEIAKDVQEEYGRKILKFAVGAFWRAAKKQEPKAKLESLQFYRRVNQLSPWSNYGKGAKEAMVRLKRELQMVEATGLSKLYKGKIDGTAQDQIMKHDYPVQRKAFPRTYVPKSAVPDVVIPPTSQLKESLTP